jgi:predicted PurR-regulated permease PerM
MFGAGVDAVLRTSRPSAFPGAPNPALIKRSSNESFALGVLAFVSALTVICVVIPVGSGVLLGGLLGLTAHGFYQRLSRRTGKPALIAAGLTSVTTLLVAGTLGALLYVLVRQGMHVKEMLSGDGSADLATHLTGPLAALGLEPASVIDKVRNEAGSLAGSLATWAGRIVGTLIGGALALLFTTTTMYFVLRHWVELSKEAEDLLPLNPHHTRRLMHEVRRIARSVVIGNLGTGLVQGVLAAIGYWIARLPDPVFFGALTALASIVPAFGTMLIWLPAGLMLLATGHPAAGGFELAWGALAVVGASDYIVRPKLVGRGEATSTWMTFVALFGGIELFGIVGLLLGPLLVSLSLAVLKVYRRTRLFRLRVS